MREMQALVVHRCQHRPRIAGNALGVQKIGCGQGSVQAQRASGVRVVNIERVRASAIFYRINKYASTEVLCGGERLARSRRGKGGFPVKNDQSVVAAAWVYAKTCVSFELHCVATRGGDGGSRRFLRDSGSHRKSRSSPRLKYQVPMPWLLMRRANTVAIIR